MNHNHLQFLSEIFVMNAWFGLMQISLTTDWNDLPQFSAWTLLQTILVALWCICFSTIDQWLILWAVHTWVDPWSLIPILQSSWEWRRPVQLWATDQRERFVIDSTKPDDRNNCHSTQGHCWIEIICFLGATGTRHLHGWHWLDHSSDFVPTHQWWASTWFCHVEIWEERRRK